MEEKLIGLLTDLVSGFGIACNQINGLDFTALSADYIEASLLQFLTREKEKDIRHYFENLPIGVISSITDPFRIHYLAVRLSPAEDRHLRFLSIGPYLLSPDAAEPRSKDTASADPVTAGLIQKYRQLVPVCSDPQQLEYIVTCCTKALFGVEPSIRPISYADIDTEPNPSILFDDEKISMDQIADRYRIENHQLEAIREGNYTKAISFHFPMYEKDLWYTALLPQGRHALYTFNTLCRKSVEEAAVHPAHIDHISRSFTAQIDAAHSIAELSEIRNKMIRSYCLLVRNYSLIEYSQRIRDTINYIDFNLAEDLSLDILADRACVTKKVLSAQFKKETGRTVTDYISHQRIAKARKYLSVTDLPVQEIAEHVGILDVNYFSRLFRKLEDMSPSEYRKMVHSS